MAKQTPPTDRQLLEELYGFLLGKNFVQFSGLDSLRDMVKRYQNPPLTMHKRVCMQMTVNEYDAYFALITKVHEHIMGTTPIEAKNDTHGINDRWPFGDVPSDTLIARRSRTE